MKNKKVFIMVAIVILIIISIFSWLNYEKSGEEDFVDYTPAEELGEEQLRNTMITLYFKSKDKFELASETRLIDATMLIESPYDTLINFLISGPKYDMLEPLMPENVMLNSTRLENGVLHVDIEGELSELAIESIVCTLSELKEVNEVKIENFH